MDWQTEDETEDGDAIVPMCFIAIVVAGLVLAMMGGCA